MTQWEIWTWEFPKAGAHPAVIVSHPTTIATRDEINVLLCATQRRAPRVHEVLLDVADGLDWPTLCRCDVLYVPEKARLTVRRGIVCPARQRAIVSRIMQCFGWAGF
jgi:mRNA-degrading endonuclease toxin of MazEF toxin-antitoxin module